MQSSVVESVSVWEGHSLFIGSLHQPRPWYPSLDERAALVKQALPSWAIASGITAGWVWTGMGLAEPWSVLRPRTPGLSPLERILWRACIRNPRHHDTTVVQGLTLLTPQSAVREILLDNADIDQSATQILFLSSDPCELLRAREYERRASPRSRHHADLILSRLHHLRETYPDITR